MTADQFCFLAKRASPVVLCDMAPGSLSRASMNSVSPFFTTLIDCVASITIQEAGNPSSGTQKEYIWFRCLMEIWFHSLLLTWCRERDKGQGRHGEKA